MAGHATGAQYVNFLGAEADTDPGAAREQDVPLDAWQRAAAVYGEQKLARLAAVKRRYDPDNIFRLNHNIPPVPTAGEGRRPIVSTASVRSESAE